MKRHLNLLPRWGSRYLLAYGRAWKGVLHTWSMRQESWTVANQSQRMLCNAVHCARFFWWDSCAVLCFQALDEMILLQDRDAVLGSEEELHEQGPDIAIACRSICPKLGFYTCFLCSYLRICATWWISGIDFRQELGSMKFEGLAPSWMRLIKEPRQLCVSCTGNSGRDTSIPSVLQCVCSSHL